MSLSMGECKKTNAPNAQRKNVRVIVSVKENSNSDFRPMKGKVNFVAHVASNRSMFGPGGQSPMTG